jgi:hypothetical protein
MGIARLAFAAAVSIWVLQHYLKSAEDISLIRCGLERHGYLFVLNNIYRAVSTKEMGWADDDSTFEPCSPRNWCPARPTTFHATKIAPAMSDLHFLACLEIR